MLLAAVWIPDVRELVGQLVRIVAAGIGSAMGNYPAGNTGRARVGITRPMPIPPELQTILDEVDAALHASAAR